MNPPKPSDWAKLPALEALPPITLPFAYVASRGPDPADDPKAHPSQPDATRRHDVAPWRGWPALEGAEHATPLLPQAVLLDVSRQIGAILGAEPGYVALLGPFAQGPARARVRTPGKVSYLIGKLLTCPRAREDAGD